MLWSMVRTRRTSRRIHTTDTAKVSYNSLPWFFGAVFHLSYPVLAAAAALLMLLLYIHSSCEIEDLFETHLCKLCVILRSRVLLSVSSLDIGRRLRLELPCSLYQGQQGDVSQSILLLYCIALFLVQHCFITLLLASPMLSSSSLKYRK